MVFQEGHLEAGLQYMYIFHFLYVATSRNNLYSSMDFPGGSDGKEFVRNAWDLGSIFPGLGRSPGGGHGNPLQYSCLENPHGQRSLAGCSPWGHRESDTTEWLRAAHIEFWVAPETDVNAPQVGGSADSR